MTELHAALIRADFTTLRLMQPAAGEFQLRLSRDWDEALDWSTYTRSYCLDQVPCAAPIVAGDAEARAILGGLGAGTKLAKLEDLMLAGRHEMLVLRAHQRLGMRCVNNVHSSRLGSNNGHHAIRAGGVRRHEAEEEEHDVLVDGLNLGRGMSYKNAAARIPFGGTKMTVQCHPFPLDDLERLGFLAYCIDAGHFFTGPDMGFAPELADALREHFTHNIVGGPGGSMGPTGKPTAEGVFLALGECARFRWGDSGLEGRSVLIQGLGAVGLPLARLLRKAGIRVLVADSNAASTRNARRNLNGLEVVPCHRALETACDVLAPCAVGGILDEATIEGLCCAVICGAANNQLRAGSRAGEEELAARIAARGIVYVPEWTINIAGVIAGREEYVHQAEAQMERIQALLNEVCRDGTARLLKRADSLGRSPTEVAYDEVESRIYGVT